MRLNRPGELFWIAFIIMMALAQRPAHASLQDLFGFGFRGPGMGNASVASAYGFESVYYNPAGLTILPLTNIAVGYQISLYSLNIEASMLDSDRLNKVQNVDAAKGLIFGASLFIPLKGFMHKRLALGVGLVMPGDVVVRAWLPRPYSPNFVVIGNRGHIVAVQLAGAVKIIDGLSIGAGINALAGLSGKIDVGPNILGRIGSKVGDQLITDFSPIVGIIWTPLKVLSLGLVYRGVSIAKFTLPIDADLGSQVPIVVPTLNITGVAQYDPRQVTFHVAYRPIPSLVMEVGLNWKHWAAFPLPIADTTTGTPPQEQPKFHNTLVPRFGIEWLATDAKHFRLIIRSGYYFEKTPVPLQRGLSNYLDNDRHVFSLGLGMEYKKDETLFVRVDWYWQHHFLVSRTNVKDPAVTGIAENTGFPRIRSGGQILSMGGAVVIGF